MILRRALLGGTFDPPHIGHLALAQAAWEQLAVDTVTFLPAGDPWQKTDRGRLTPAVVRAEMVEAAVAGTPYFGVDRREIEREGPTYTWDTLQSFEGEEPVLVLGADTAAGLPSWHRADRLIDTVEIAVVARPGTPRDLVERAAPAARWLEMPALDISSTELRTWIGRGYSARFLVPDAVLDVIAGHGLYSAARNPDAR